MRVIAVEIQALAIVAVGEGRNVRRTVNGINHSRLLLLLGVLQKRCGLSLARQDVYVNVVGKMKPEGNTADLAIAVALASSLKKIDVRSDTAFVGEVGLLGELRTVPALEKRIQEAKRMGFSRVVTPFNFRHKTNRKTSRSRLDGIDWIQCTTLASAINEGLVQPIPPPVAATQRRVKQIKTEETPGNLRDLRLEDIIMDDEEDDDEFL